MIVATLLNITIFQGIVLGILFLTSPLFKSKANNFLAFAVLSLSISLFNLVLDITEGVQSYPILRWVDILDPGMLFPLFILFFVLHQVSHPKKNSKQLYWLSVPYILSTLQSLIEEFFFGSQEIEPSLSVEIFTFVYDLILFLITAFFIPFILWYTFKCINYSKRKEKRWLFYLWGFELVFYGSWLITLFVSIFVEFDVPSVMQIIALFSTLMIHSVAFLGVYRFKLARDPEEMKVFLTQQSEVKNTNILPSDLSEKSATKKEGNGKELLYFEQLEAMCKEDRIFIDATLDRVKVAEMLGISPGYLSQLVNSNSGDNFSTYINRYRVEAVKQLILDPAFDDYSLLAIGLECGFSSKTTFYNSFKKIVGMTPSAFRKEHQ